MVEAKKVENIEFKWGKQRGVGGKKKDVKFYESFSYDHVEYALYDSVYMYEEGETEPYIAKLMKIWENADKTKKVKVLWFFCPREISKYLGDEKTPENELFLASGEGVGSTNVNPLEAIAGKCNVVCSSKDSRNPQPSEEELQEADFVFYRTFDVGNCRILDKIDDKIAGIEVKFLLNRVGNQSSSGVPKLDSNKKVLIEEKVKVDKDCGDLDDRPSKKAKLDDLAKASYDNKVTGVQKVSHDSNGSNSKSVAQTTPASEDKSKSNLTKDHHENNSSLSKRPKPDEKLTRLANGKFPEASLRQPSEEGSKTNCQIQEVTRRPEADRSKWFRGLPWEERMQTAHEQETLVLLQNLDPSYTSAEVEDIIWHAFKQSCTVKMIQKTALASPHSGQAFVIFQKREVAEMAVAKLDEGCLMLSNGRYGFTLFQHWSTSIKYFLLSGSTLPVEIPAKAFQFYQYYCPPQLKTFEVKPQTILHDGIVLHQCVAAQFALFHAGKDDQLVDNAAAYPSIHIHFCRPVVGSIAAPCFPGKQSTFFGHLVINKLRTHKQREMKEAVSTSHCSQPNTLEYEMAMDWCLLQERSDLALRKLRQQQRQELRKLWVTLKCK